MTLPLAAEAVGDLAEASAASGESTAVVGAARTRSITQKTGVKPPKPKVHGASAQGRPAAPNRASKGPAQRKSSTGSLRGFAGPKITGGKGGGAHKLVIVEFILCLVLVGMSPILTREPGDTGHLYVPNDFIRLTATCLLFFVLALMANSPRAGRFAAAFGALVTLGAFFNSNKALVALGSIFNAHAATTSTSATPATGPTLPVTSTGSDF